MDILSYCNCHKHGRQSGGKVVTGGQGGRQCGGRCGGQYGGQGGGHRVSGPEVFRIGRFVFPILHCAVSSSPCSQCDFESTHVGNIKNHKESPATWSAL